MRGIWAITWRSIVYLPVTAVVGIGLIALPILVIVLPVAALMHTFVGAWMEAALCILAWILAITLAVNKRVRGWYQRPPSLL